MGNRMSRLVESNILEGTESFPIPAVLKYNAYVNPLLTTAVKLLWLRVILLSRVHRRPVTCVVAVWG